mmetsp:Transcript_42571/g.90539  ORF Transcript_42571/g.90539 Transcript_42571/m.90539 type:complete len:219 (+) Transcript_42571:240-896(+)
MSSFDPCFRSTDDISFPMTLVKVENHRTNAVTSGERFRPPNPRESSTMPYLDLSIDLSAVLRSNSAEMMPGMGRGVPNSRSSKSSGHISYMYTPRPSSEGGNPSPLGSTALTLLRSLCALAECKNGVSFFFNFNLDLFRLASMLWSKNLMSGASAALCIFLVTKSSNCCVSASSSRKGRNSTGDAATNSSVLNLSEDNPSFPRQVVRSSIDPSGKNLR